MGEHSVPLLALVAVSLLAFIATLVINVYASNTGSAKNNLFLNSTGIISGDYPTEVTPAKWTFSIWAIVYFFQVFWKFYLLSTVCRQNSYGEYLYVDPGVLSWQVLVFYLVANICNVGWLFLWDRRLLVPSLLVIALIPFNLYIALVYATRSLKEKYQEMLRLDLWCDIWANRILVHNGIAIYAAWTSIATLINLAIVLVYGSPIHVSDETASTIVLGIITFELVLWTLLDFILFDAYTRYVVTPYFVAVFAVAGILSNQHNPDLRNRTFSTVLVGLASLLMAMKIGLIVVRGLTSPSEEEQPLKGGSECQSHT